MPVSSRTGRRLHSRDRLRSPTWGADRKPGSPDPDWQAAPLCLRQLNPGGPQDYLYILPRSIEMEKEWILTSEEIEPLLEGLAIQGTGGGGSPDWGRQILENEFRRGRTMRLVDPDALPD